MLEYLSIGQIINTHGVRGEVKVYPLTDNTDRFSSLKKVYIELQRDLAQLEITNVKYLSTTVVIKFRGIDSVEEAEKLRGKYIKVDRENAVKLPENSYFICDLIDMEVYSIESVFLGTIKEIQKTGSNDVFVVSKDNKEILIPALKSIFKEINIEEGKIVVELPEGLL